MTKEMAHPVLAIPPSAMTGTPYSAASLDVWYTAEICARPTALTSCAVLIVAAPMPTRIPSTPASIKCRLEKERKERREAREEKKREKRREEKRRKEREKREGNVSKKGDSLYDYKTNK